MDSKTKNKTYSSHARVYQAQIYQFEHPEKEIKPEPVISSQLLFLNPKYISPNPIF